MSMPCRRIKACIGLDARQEHVRLQTVICRGALQWHITCCMLNTGNETQLYSLQGHSYYQRGWKVCALSVRARQGSKTVLAPSIFEGLLWEQALSIWSAAVPAKLQPQPTSMRSCSSAAARSKRARSLRARPACRVRNMHHAQHVFPVDMSSDMQT